ncbi:MAG: MATE family efflux transporter [Eubacterium sp.]|nr:MATE family efflux transporter [Eubacterium sp.]
MAKTSADNNKIITGTIWKQLLLFFFPLLFGTFFQMLYNTADSVIVGRFVGVGALSAIGGAAAQIVALVVGAFLGLCSGATVVIAQYYGAGKKSSVETAVHTAVAMSLGLGMILAITGAILARPMLVLMDTPYESLEDSVIYLIIYFIGMPVNLLYNMGAAILRAIGDSKRPLYYLIVSTLTNIVLDLLFVAGFKMGVAGAAIATVLCQAVSAILVLVCLLKADDCYRLDIRKIRINWSCLRQILWIGIPSMIQSMAYSISNVILQVVVNGFGTYYVAAWAVCSKGDQVFWMMSNSFGIAVTTFISQNYGAGLFERVRKCLRQSILIDLVMTSVTQVCLYLSAPFITNLFTTNHAVAGLGVYMMRFFIPTYLLFLCIEVFAAVLRGIGDPLLPMIIDISGVCLLRILWVVFALPHWPGFDTVMYSYPVSWAVTSVLMVVYYLVRWRKKLSVKSA